MPEVIEVLKYADFIKTKLRGKKITEINIGNGRYKKHGDFEHLDSLRKSLSLKVTDVKTKGKFLYFVFENGMYLFSTLGLSGGWAWSKSNTYCFVDIFDHIEKEELDAWHKRATEHINVEFVTDKGSLCYFDVLSYGTLKVVLTEEELTKKLNTIGPDITAKETTLEEFTKQLQKAREDSYIANTLLNQKVISGMGNYLRADILWLCKISPYRKMKDIETNEYRKLWKAARLLTWSKYDYKKGIELGFIDENHSKLPEDYNREFYVYEQKEDPQGHKTTKEKLGDRYITWVPTIQK